MADAKREIDVLNDQANAAKLHALVEAQEQASKDIAQLADQVAVLGQLDTQNLLQSTTTTIIKSQAQATGNAEVVATTPVVETIAITSQRQKNVVADDQLQVAVKGYVCEKTRSRKKTNIIRCVLVHQNSCLRRRLQCPMSKQPPNQHEIIPPFKQNQTNLYIFFFQFVTRDPLLLGLDR